MSRPRGGDRGTAVVETALILGLLMMVAIGAVEYGLAFLHWNSAVSSSREGARVAAQAGDEVNPLLPGTTDCAIIEASAGPLVSGSNDVEEIWIYESDSSGTVGAARQRYRRATLSDTTDLLTCSGSVWVRLQNGWPATSRINTGSAANRDWVGIRIVFDHVWFSGFLWWNGSVCDTQCWEHDTVMHIEPEGT